MNVLVADKVDEQFSYLQQAIVINKGKLYLTANKILFYS